MNISGNRILEKMMVLGCRQHEFPDKYIHAIIVGMNISHISVILKELWGIQVAFTDFLK